MKLMETLRTKANDYLQEKKREVQRMKQVQMKAKEAAMLEREKQMIRVAVEKEKIKADKKLQNIKEKGSVTNSLLEGIVGKPSPQKKKTKRKKKKEPVQVMEADFNKIERIEF